eukprot:SAG31_NODE_38125_length_298_cov_2.030151_1_plen_44_part_01
MDTDDTRRGVQPYLNLGIPSDLGTYGGCRYPDQAAVSYRTDKRA